MKRSSLPHSVVFLYFFALITGGGFVSGETLASRGGPRGQGRKPVGVSISVKLYKKDPHDPDNHDRVITHLEPDILECEVKWALGKHHYKQR